MNPKHDYYEILHVHPDAPREIIKSSYRTLMHRMRMHPDLGGDSSTAAMINEAYGVLMEPDRRASYDQYRMSLAANESFKESPEERSVQGEGSGFTQSYEAPLSAAFSARFSARLYEGNCKFCFAPYSVYSDDREQIFCSQCDSPHLMMGQMQGSGEDRRTIFRVSKNSPVEFFTQRSPREAMTARTEDVSLTGMRFRTAVVLQPGQIIKVNMQVLSGIVEVTRLLECGSEWDVGSRFLSLHFDGPRGTFIRHCV